MTTIYSKTLHLGYLFSTATLIWPEKRSVSHFLYIKRNCLYSHPINTAKYLWPVGDWIIRVPMYLQFVSHAIPGLGGWLLTLEQLTTSTS